MVFLESDRTCKSFQPGLKKSRFLCGVAALARIGLPGRLVARCIVYHLVLASMALFYD